MKDMKMNKFGKNPDFLAMVKSICENCGDSIWSIDNEFSITKKFLRKHITIGERSDEELNDLRKFARSLFNAIKKKTDEAYATEAGSWVDVVALVSNDNEHFTKAFQAFKTEFNY
jgi:hypothetical protein